MSNKYSMNNTSILAAISSSMVAFCMTGCDIEKEESAIDEPIPIELDDPCFSISCDEPHRGVCLSVGDEAECHCDEGYVEEDDGSCLWADADATLTVQISQSCPGYVMASEGPVEIHCGQEQCTATAPVGSEVRLEAYSVDFCVFDSWENCSFSDGSSCMVTLDGDTTVVAHFVNQPSY